MMTEKQFNLLFGIGITEKRPMDCSLGQNWKGETIINSEMNDTIRTIGSVLYTVNVYNKETDKEVFEVEDCESIQEAIEEIKMQFDII